MVLPVRNPEKAKSLFGSPSCIQYIQWTLGEPLSLDGTASYFFHATCNTSSKSFQQEPATTGKGITLLTDGSKRNAYLSVDDAVRALIFLLAKGKSGEAYNAANDESYCSIREMAELVLMNFDTTNSTLIRKVNPEREATFRKSSNLKMDTSKT